MSADLKAGSKESDLAILVVSCDAYQDLWYPFFSCFFKYWPDCPYPVYLGSNCLCFPDPRVRPVLVGPDVDYTSNLLKMLEQVKQDWLILWIEDRVLSAPVNTARLGNLIRLAQNQKAGYLKLIASHPFAMVKDKSQEIGEIPRGQRYRVCITVALWKKDILLRLLHPGETAWDIERRGSQRSSQLDEKFLSLSASIMNNPPLSNVHLVTQGRVLRDACKFLKHEELQEYLRDRRIQTLWSYWGLKLYLYAKDLYVRLRWQWQHS